LAMFCTAGYTFSFGVYQDFYVRTYLNHYTPSEIGWIGSIQIWLLFAIGIVTGRAFDRGYFYHLVISGMILQAFSYFMLSLTQENKYYQVFLAHLGGAFAHGLAYIPCVGIVAHYFLHHRALAMGFVAAGVALGGVVHTILLNHLFFGPIGFAKGVRISAGINLFLYFIANLMMKPRLPPKQGGSAFPLGRYMRDLPYLFVVIGTSVMVIGLFMPIFYLQLYAVDRGINNTLNFYSLSIMNGISIFGRIVPSIFAPTIGAYNLGVFFTFLTGVAALCMPLVVNTGGLVVYAAIYGFLSGATISLGYPMFGVLAHDTSEIGSRIGIAFCVVGFVGLSSSPIIGAVLSSEFHWWRAAILSGTTVIASAVLNGIARTYLARRKGSQRV